MCFSRIPFTRWPLIDVIVNKIIYGRFTSVCVFLKQEEDNVSRQQMSDLRMRMSKAKECFDRHRQVLDRLRVLQLNKPADTVSVGASSTSALQPADTSR